MIPADNSSESPKKPDPPVAPPNPEFNGQNGPSEKKSGYWPFDEPQPPKLTPEEIESLLQLWDEEDEREAAAGLREILEGRGVSSEEFLRTIEQAARDDG